MRDKRVVASRDAIDEHDQVQHELERRGVSRDFAAEVARALAPFVADLGPAHCEAVLSGVRLAYGVHMRRSEAVHRGTDEIEEIQRLMGSFAPELQKLDEVLEILAAYVARMRNETAPAASPTLH